MAKMEDIISYICTNYPHKDELSKARLTKMVYLADWKSAITSGSQLSNVRWKYNRYGPYAESVVNTVQRSQNLWLEKSMTIYGNDKELIRCKRRPKLDSLTETERDTLDHVINATKDKYWSDFIRLVYSTFPIVASRQFDSLDLVKLAEEYATKEETI